MTSRDTALADEIERFNAIIDRVEDRCMAADGPVTPTLKEMREDELAALWRHLQVIKTALRRTPAPALDVETVARVINPVAWLTCEQRGEDFEEHPHAGLPWWIEEKAESLAAAERVLALLPPPASSEPAPSGQGEKDLTGKLHRIADASKREDGSEIPLGETCREAATALAAAQAAAALRQERT